MTIELNNISSGYSTGLINENFQKLEDYLNENLLNRDNLSTGEPNHMEVALDMNGNSILNVSTTLTDSGSLLTVGDADSRYINTSGDTLAGALDMAGNAITVRVPLLGNEPARKDQLDSTIAGYQAGDASLQAQISGGDPLEASAFSEISWHDQVISNSVTIPDNKNAWSIGPEMSIASGQTITVGSGSSWTIVEGNLV